MKDTSKKFVIKEATRKRCQVFPYDEKSKKRFMPISLEHFEYLKDAKSIDFSLYFRNHKEIIEFIKPNELSHELLVQMQGATLIADADVEVCLLRSDYPRYEMVITEARKRKMKNVFERDQTLDVNVMEVYGTLSAASQMIVRGGINAEVASKATDAATMIMQIQLKHEVALGTLSRMVQCDSTLYDHSASVAMLSSIIATRILKKPLSLKEAVLVAQCGLYHDAGKACVPNHVLNKPGIFSEEEFEVMKNHTLYGHDELMKAIRTGAPIDPLAARVALEHHERFNGMGYPHKKKGRLEEDPNGIHLYTRIVAIADVYSALLMKRVYKEAMSSQEAIELMKTFADRDFDPEIFAPFYDSIHASIETFKQREKQLKGGVVKMIGENDSFIQAIIETKRESSKK